MDKKPNIISRFKDKVNALSFSTKFIVGGSILSIFMLFATSSAWGANLLNFGALDLLRLMALFMTVMFIGVLHVCRKALFDYINMGKLYEEALKGNIAASVVFGGVCIAMLAIAVVIAVSVTTFA